MDFIPLFPEFREIKLSDKPFFNEYFNAINPLISEFTFTNIFIFKDIHSYKITLLNNSLCILGKSYKGELYFLPPLGENKIEDTILELFSFMKSIGESPLLCMLDENYLNRYIKGNSKFIYQLDRDNFDYLYLAEDLINLKGNRYHKKKNLINQFLKRYNFRYEEIRKEIISKCLDLVDRWCQVKCQGDSVSTVLEAMAAKVALMNFDKLDIKGRVVIIDDRVEAMAIGEPLNKDTVVIHIEKANNAFTGLYQFINREFCSSEWSEYKFINREQDLGIEGLRKAKLSYNPIGFINKYRVSEVKNGS